MKKAILLGLIIVLVGTSAVSIASKIDKIRVPRDDAPQTIIQRTETPYPVPTFPPLPLATSSCEFLDKECPSRPTTQ